MWCPPRPPSASAKVVHLAGDVGADVDRGVELAPVEHARSASRSAQQVLGVVEGGVVRSGRDAAP